MSPDQAAKLVNNALSRAPQDELEAAVVLEAWGGSRTTEGLRLGVEALSHDHVDTRVGSLDDDRLPPDQRTASMASGIAVLVAIVAMALWAIPLSDVYGDSNVAVAWRLALPVTLALQSWFTIRHASQIGLGSLPGHRGEYALVSLVAIGGLALVPAPVGPLAAVFVMTWATGAVLVQRGWYFGFAISNVGVSIALLSGVQPAVALGVTTVGLVVGAVVATHGQDEMVVAGPNARAVVAAVTGALLGVLLVIDPSIEWDSAGYVPILALVPALVGNIWAAVYLSRLWVEVPRQLMAYNAKLYSRSALSLSWSVLSGAFARFMAAALPLSVIVAAIISNTGVPMGRIVSLLAGLEIAMVASLGLILLDIFRHQIRAALAAGSGCLAAISVALIGAPFAGAALVVGALVTTLLIAKPIWFALRHPDRTYATAMLLP